MDYLKSFLIGGCVIAGSKIVSKYASPALAPIVGGMPTGIIASFFLSSQSDKRSFYSGYFYTSILLALTIVLIHLITMNNTKMNVDVASGIGLIAWAIVSYFVVNYFVPTKKK